MKDKLIDIGKGVAGIFAYFFLSYASSTILGVLGITTEKVGKIGAAIISTIYSLFIVGILILISRKKIVKDFKDFLKNNKGFFKRNAKYWLYAIIVMVTSNLLIGLIFQTTTSANDQTIRELFDVFPIYVYISAVIIAPLTEELVFRQSIRYIIANKYLFVIVSGLIFGFMHIITNMTTLADILYIIPYSAPGCAFAYMLVKEDNIFVPISFHLLHNGITISLLIIGKLLGAV